CIRGEHFDLIPKVVVVAIIVQCMTRINTSHLHQINHEIDRTYCRLVRQNMNLPFHSVSDMILYILCHILILLSEFHGFAGEDPHKHLKEFHIVFSTMKPHDVQDDHICLKAFPHSLEGSAKDYLYYLAPGSITSWSDLKRSFLGKLFPASRTIAFRKDISGISQQHVESLYEFKRLCASFAHHQISKQLLLQYFYEGLNNMDMGIIDVASGGALGDMTHFEAKCLFIICLQLKQNLSLKKNLMQMHKKRKNSVLEDKKNTTKETHANQPSSSVSQQPFSIPLPFPPKSIPNKNMGNMEELDKDLLDTFEKVEVNIPLLDAIKQIPRYPMFLKEL
ncbi:hypothetical protein Lal_00013483, partial [Lupinus albus]